MKSWCIGAPSAKYVAKMEDVLEVYARPYDPKRPVVCVDEGAKELRSTPRGSLAMEPGEPERQDYEYARHGKANLFVSVEPLTGRRRIRVSERRASVDFAEELRIVVDIEHVLHLGHILGRRLADAPTLHAPRFKFVFLSRW